MNLNNIRKSHIFRARKSLFNTILIVIFLTSSFFIFPLTTFNTGNNLNQRNPNTLKISYGEDFFFSQRDPAWKDDPIIDENGITQGTIESIGCAMTSCAMVLKYYMEDTDPKQLNTWLNGNSGYASGGLIYWAKITEYSNGEVNWVDNSGSDTWFFWDDQYYHWDILRTEIEAGFLVIVEVDADTTTASLEPHWVLVTKFNGGDITDPANYYINDPWDYPQDPNKLLSHYYDATYQNTFFAMRFYRGTLEPKPTITSSLTIEQPDPYYIGDEISGSFTIKNKGNIPITFEVLTIGGRDPDGQVADFTFLYDITLDPGEDFNYYGTLTLIKSGTYHFFCTYKLYGQEFNPSVPTDPGIINVKDIYVYQIPNNPPTPTFVWQIGENGHTIVPDGATIQERTINFMAPVIDPDGNSVRLEIELRQTNEALTGIPNFYSDYFPSEEFATIMVNNLNDGTYHWQGRTTDSLGASCFWFSYGTFSVEASHDLYITSSLIISTSPPYFIGQLIEGEFTITNRGTTPISSGSVTILGQDPDNEPIEFAYRSLDLNPGESFNFYRTFYLEKTGIYHLYCAYKTFYGDWIYPVPTDPGVTNSLDLIVSYLQIHSNNDWEILAEIASFCTGSGTKQDPYIISGLDIDAIQNDYGILIENTNVYFLIDYCTIANAQEAAIRLCNVENGKLTNNQFLYNQIGINIYEGTDILIATNTIHHNRLSGIGVSNSADITIYQNDVTMNDGWGIFIYESDRSHIIGNSVIENGQVGILIESDIGTTDNNIISNNTVSYNEWNGIYLERSIFSEISRNTIKYNNHEGIKLFESHSNKIFENYVVNNQAGIGLENSNDNIIFMNTFYQNNVDAISVDSSNYFNSLEQITYFYQDAVFQNYLGNYWSNYLGNDLDSDGIGEISYVFDGLTDNYPLVDYNSKYHKSSMKPSLFDGLFFEGYAIMSYDLVLNARITYAYQGNNIFRADMVTDVWNAWYDLHHKTRLILASGGELYFGINVHAPYWIFPDVKIGETVLVAIDGDGDHLFRVSQTLLYEYGTSDIEVWKLEDLSLPDGSLYFEKNTGLLVGGMVYFYGGLYNYTFELTDTNANFGIINHPPDKPSLIMQLRYQDGELSLIEEGEIIASDTVVFYGLLNDPDDDDVRLEIELRRIEEPFIGVPTTDTISEFVSSGEDVSIFRYGLTEGDYHWQYRAKDSKGSVSDWKEYGASGNVDFTIFYYINFQLPEDWNDKEFFTPYVRLKSLDSNNFEIGIQNKNDMWYVVKIYRRFSEQEPWIEYIPEEWSEERWEKILPPFGDFFFEYTPQRNEMIKIVVSKNNYEEILGSLKLGGLQIFDFLTRLILGKTLMEMTTLEAFVRVWMETLGIEDVIGTIWDWLVKHEEDGLEKFVLGILSYAAQNADVLVLIVTGISTPTMGDFFGSVLLSAAIAPYVFLANLLINLNLAKGLLINLAPFDMQESVILETYESGPRLPLKVALDENLSIIEDSPYYVDRIVMAEFSIENLDFEPILLKTLTVQALDPNGNIQYFSSETNVNINPGESHIYRGWMKLLVPGSYHLFVIYETFEHYWETDVPTAEGIQNSLDIDVEPIPSFWEGWTLWSPAEIRVMDSQGRITGLLNGEIYNEIPFSSYFDGTIIICYPEDSYTCELEGYTEGIYNLTIGRSTSGVSTSFVAFNIPIALEEFHYYTVDWDNLSHDEEGVTVDIDSDGDGTIDHSFTSNNELNTAEYVIGTIIWLEEGKALQDGVIFEIEAFDDTLVEWIKISIREPGGENGIIIPGNEFEEIPLGYQGDNLWSSLEPFDTIKLPDGYYVLFVQASDIFGSINATTFSFSIRNWEILEQLPATENYRAGRTIPIKFSLRVVEAVDPEMPFVWSEELEIIIYDENNPDIILQYSIFGDTSVDYRINSKAELYITNFKTLKTEATYVVEIWRKGMLIGWFEFETYNSKISVETSVSSTFENLQILQGLNLTFLLLGMTCLLIISRKKLIHF